MVEDGSTDQTRDILMRVRSGNRRLQLIEQANAGVGAARNAGILAARCDYLIFVDGDDWIVPGALDIWRNVVKRRPDVGFSNRILFEDDSGREKLGRSVKQLDFGRIERAPKEANYGAVTSKIFKRRCIMEHKLRFPSTRYWEDNVFTYAFNAVAVTAASTDAATYVVRRRRAGSEKSITQRRLDLDVLNARFEIIPACLEIVDRTLQKKFPKYRFVETHFDQLIWHHTQPLVLDSDFDPRLILDPIRSFAEPYLDRIRKECRSETVAAYEALAAGQYDAVIALASERYERILRREAEREQVAG